MIGYLIFSAYRLYNFHILETSTENLISFLNPKLLSTHVKACKTYPIPNLPTFFWTVKLP